MEKIAYQEKTFADAPRQTRLTARYEGRWPREGGADGPTLHALRSSLLVFSPVVTTRAAASSAVAPHVATREASLKGVPRHPAIIFSNRRHHGDANSTAPARGAHGSRVFDYAGGGGACERLLAREQDVEAQVLARRGRVAKDAGRHVLHAAFEVGSDMCMEMTMSTGAGGGDAVGSAGPASPCPEPCSTMSTEGAIAGRATAVRHDDDANMRASTRTVPAPLPGGRYPTGRGIAWCPVFLKSVSAKKE